MTEDQTQQPPALLLGSRFAMLLGLTGLAISQPLLNTLSSNPATFEFYNFESSDIVLFALMLAFAPPVVLWLAETLVYLANKDLGGWVHLTFCGVLFALFVQQLLIQIDLDLAVVTWICSVAAGAGLVLAMLRFDAVSSWLALVGILPLVSVFLFLFSSPIADLVNPPDQVDAVAAPERDQAPPSVVMLLFDELATQSIMTSDQQVDPGRFPNFAELASDSTWYRHSTTLSPFTQTAVPAILAGIEPSEEGKQPNWIDYPDNLFRLLGASHHLTVSESVTNLCGVAGCTSKPNPPPPTGESRFDVEPETESGDDADFAAIRELTIDLFEDRVNPTSSEQAPLDDFEESVQSLDPKGSGSSGFADAKTLDEPSSPELEHDADKRFTNQPSRLVEFVEAIRASDQPTLYFLHLVLPHQPWRYDADGSEYLLPPPALAKPDRSGSSSQWLSNTVRQRHFLQATYADALLGEILDQTKAEGIYEDALVVVLADHGVAFEPGLLTREYLPETRSGVAYAPLFIKSPGQSKGSVSDTNAMTIDVLPTIAGELDSPIPWAVDGIDLASAEAAERGPMKRIYDWVQDPTPDLRGPVDFDDGEVYGELLEGIFPPMTDPDDPLSGLWATSEAGGLVGMSLDDLTLVEDVEVDLEVADAYTIEDPGDGPPIGFVTGFIDESDLDDLDGEAIALVVDDTIVAISEIEEKSGREGWFGTPLDAPYRAPVDFELYLVDPVSNVATATDWNSR